MEIREIRDGSVEKVEMMVWEQVEGWEVESWVEGGGSSAGEAVRDEMFPGGGGAGAATGSGGNAVTRRGVGEVTGRGGNEVTRRGVGEVAGRGREVTGLYDFGGGGEEEEEDWEVVERVEGSSLSEAVWGDVFPGGDVVGEAMGSRGVELTVRDVGEVAERGRIEETGHCSGDAGEETDRCDFGGSGGEEEEDWEVVEGSGASVAVWGDVFPGGGVVGEAMGSGRDEKTCRGGGELTVRGGGGGGWFDSAKRTVIAGGARLLFYPTLARNVALNKVQSGFNWWDRIDEHIVLGAVPFQSHVPQLMQLGVRAVVTLTEPFETLVPTSYYGEHVIEHLEIPTPDYSAAPSVKKIISALNLMHTHASRGDSIYVHCKAGRGRSTTVVLCYLIKYKNMSPEKAWNHTRAIRPRVSLTSDQKEAVTQFAKLLQSSNPLCERTVVVADSDPMRYNNGDADMDVSSEEVKAYDKPNSRTTRPES